MHCTFIRRLNRMMIPGFDRSRFRPAVRATLTRETLVDVCQKHIPSGYTLRKRKPYEYFVLDERQQVAGLLTPLPLSPFPEVADHGCVNVESYLHQQSTVAQDFKSFVTFWHRGGVSLCTVSQSGDMVAPLQEFYNFGSFDGLQNHRGVNLMHHGASAAFYDQFFTHVSQSYTENIGATQQFLKLNTMEGSQLFMHVLRAYRQDYQPHCPLDLQDRRWVDIQIDSGDVSAICRGKGTSIVGLLAFLRRGRLWMDTDITLTHSAATPAGPNIAADAHTDTKPS